MVFLEVDGTHLDTGHRRGQPVGLAYSSQILEFEALSVTLIQHYFVYSQDFSSYSRSVYKENNQCYDCRF